MQRWSGKTRRRSDQPHFPHMYRKLLNTKDLRRAGFSLSDTKIGTDISSARTTYGQKFARDVRKVGSKYEARPIIRPNVM